MVHQYHPFDINFCRLDFLLNCYNLKGNLFYSFTKIMVATKPCRNSRKVKNNFSQMQHRGSYLPVCRTWLQLTSVVPSRCSKEHLGYILVAVRSPSRRVRGLLMPKGIRGRSAISRERREQSFIVGC